MLKRLVDFDREKLNARELYYIDGMALTNVDGNHRIVDVMKNIWENPLSDGFTWEQSMNSYSLRPNVYEYDSCFMDFIFDNDIHKALTFFSGRNLTLAHIQIVKTDPGRSYQDWHRDTYQFDNNEPVGAMPPAHKVIFYPKFDKPEPRLKFILGSHRCMVNEKNFDEMLIKKFEVDAITSSNNRAVIFESSLLHAVIPDVNPKGSIRIMYSFVEHHQFEKRFGNKKNHVTLKNMYELKCESNPFSLLA